MKNNLNIVCYMGGACGDIIVGMLAPAGTTISSRHTVEIPENRRKLKIPHKFETDEDKDCYLNQLYHTTISSHDFEYHAKNGHDILYVGIQNIDRAIWAATRFKNLHFAHAWQEMTDKCGAETIEQYAQMYIDHRIMVKNYVPAKIIDVEDIISGNAVQKLSELGYDISVDGQELYNQWLEANQL